ncbi:MAG TPA: TonB-dependent receptor, partial [Paludibacteraceae bacterium]|nr:TonB-dependent receptor [Paludibacteraceae bacterium]
YYYKDISDMLFKRELPVSTGLADNTIWDNVGDVANFGVDFSLTSVNFDTKKIKWTTTFNFSTNNNRVVSLTPAVDNGGKGMDYTNGTRNVTGKPIGTFFMADYAGIDPDRGVEMIWEIDQDEYNKTGNTIKTGRKIPATQANVKQHRYVFKDKTIVPKFFGGLDNSFSFANFDFNLFFTFSGGNYIYDYNLKRASYVHNGQTVLLADLIGNMWEPGKLNAKYPLQSWGSQYNNAGWSSNADDPNFETGNEKGWWAESGAGDKNYNLESANHSRFIYKGDYLRLKNLSIGYNLPKTLISKIKLENVKITLQATNLFTLTAYPGYDPEGKSYVETAGVPNLKNYNISISAKL